MFLSFFPFFDQPHQKIEFIDHRYTRYQTYYFLESQTIQFSSEVPNAYYVIVGGGSSGSPDGGKGGSGGEVKIGVSSFSKDTSYNIVIGSGGSIPTSCSSGNINSYHGKDSSLEINNLNTKITIVAKGGIFPGCNTTNGTNGSIGGSGNGGQNIGFSSSDANGGKGANGTAFFLNEMFYGGGGGDGSQLGNRGEGGLGGGGIGGNSLNLGLNGLDNTGGGGGGGGVASFSSSGKGGSGIVIIAIPF